MTTPTLTNSANDVVIVSAARTPIASFNGAFTNITAHQLGAEAIKAALTRANLAANDVDDVVMGQVLTAGMGQCPARQAAMLAGIPQEKTALTLNQVCGSGLRAVAEAYKAIKSGAANIIIAGGQENMTQAPHLMHLRGGVKMGDAQMTDSMIKDGLWDAFNNYHMGITAENVAQHYQITRQQQDEFAAASQQKAEAAIKAGKFTAEIIPIAIKGKKEDTIIAQDEFPRFGTTTESLAKLRPAFKADGSVTAGNASGINDGAAALVIMSASEAKKRGLKPLARIASWATAGVDPALMGIGPVPASNLALQKAGWSVKDLDLIEANEAFAAQSVAVARELGFNTNKVNVNGGAIALGHPIGASGARVLVTLLHEMQKRAAGKALATLCIGGGMGIALCVEKAA